MMLPFTLIFYVVGWRRLNKDKERFVIIYCYLERVEAVVNKKVKRDKAYLSYPSNT